jgi:hypothetical protein
MRRTIAIPLLMMMLGTAPAIASTCSSRDGQKYCTCEYNQICTDSETSCQCVRGGGEPQAPVSLPTPRVATPLPMTRMPMTPRQDAPAPPRPEPATVQRQEPPAPKPAELTDGDERTPAEYVKMAETAIAAGRYGAAIDFIDKGQTRLLDRSVALNKTFDPIEDESIRQLSIAKQALNARNRQDAVKSLNAALAVMK